MNKKSYLARVRLPRTPADWLEAMMNFIFFLCGMLAVGCVVLITVYMVLSGVPAIHKIGLFRFLFGTEWASTAADPKFGILPFILSSVYGTLGATLIGVPIGLLTAVFLSKAAGPKVRTVVVTAIELLSGIPSVVFGLLGMQVLVPAVAKTFGKASGACLLSAIVVLSIMILPSIVSVSVTALNAVPPEYEQGSLALGATDTETWFKIRCACCQKRHCRRHRAGHRPRHRRGHGRDDGGRQQPQHAGQRVPQRHLPDHGHCQGNELRRRPAAAGPVQHCAGAVCVHHDHQCGAQRGAEGRRPRCITGFRPPAAPGTV